MMQQEQVEKGARAGPAVLFVGGEPRDIKSFTGAFERDFRVLGAATAAEAEELLASVSDPVGVLICDQCMPGQTAVQLLDHARACHPDIVRLLTIAACDLDDAVAAVNRCEIHRLVRKPWDLEAIRIELHAALELYRRRRHERDLLQARRRTIVSLASHIAHELSTPLSTIHTAVGGIKEYLPDLLQGYRRGVDAGFADSIPEPMLQLMDTAPGMVLSLVDRTNMMIRVLLMNAAEDAEDRSGYIQFSVRRCIGDALRTYPFREGEESLVAVEGKDFEVFGSELLLSYVTYNLLRNSLDAISEAKKGEILISLMPGPVRNRLVVRDTGAGISPRALPRVFDEFFSDKGAGRGTGMGLPFCRRVMTAFGGTIQCQSRLGEYTELELSFPGVEPAPHAPNRADEDQF